MTPPRESALNLRVFDPTLSYRCPNRSEVNDGDHRETKYSDCGLRKQAPLQRRVQGMAFVQLPPQSSGDCSSVVPSEFEVAAGDRALLTFRATPDGLP